MEGEAKKRGRPPKSPEERKGGNLTFRLHPRLRAVLEDAARLSGRTMTEEVERRVEASFAAQTPSLTAEDVRQIVRDEMGKPCGCHPHNLTLPMARAHTGSSGMPPHSSGHHSLSPSPHRTCTCGPDQHGPCGLCD